MSATMTTRETAASVPTDATAEELGIRARDLDQLCVDTIRMLAVDMTNAAASGHPGLPMGAADLAYVLWTKFLRHDPTQPDWRDRDRFVLSAGHGSALVYALLHLSGYDLPLEELRRFRQIQSRTPGHPERGVTPGIEVTTGPLGQGCGNAVGIAVAEAMVAARFNTEEHRVSSHRVFALVSDGDLMEGVSAEACSLAGHWGLGNLVFLYDANKISIDGSTDLAFTEDVGGRFNAYGWFVQRCDGHDREALELAVERACAERSRPSIVICRTVIGRGSPNREGTEKVHGSPLGGDETKLTKAHYGWPAEPTFAVPAEVRERFAARAAEGREERLRWERAVEAWRAADSESHMAWEGLWRREPGEPRELLAKVVDGWQPGSKATRQHSQAVLQKLAALVPGLVGGSADLAGSNNTWIEGSPPVGPTKPGQRPTPELFRGRNFHFGVREHAMGAIQNGMDAHGAFIPYGATFLAFLDYMREPVRLASLSMHGSIFIFSHDSVGLGEDGPTHQPVEHLWSARVIPGVTLHRPADGLETAAAWADAVARRTGPTVLVLTRQTLAELPRPADFDRNVMLRGGYVLAEATGGAPSVVLIATGSEVAPALEARKRMEAAGVPTRLVSMLSVELFDRQDPEWRRHVLPDGVPRVAIEAGRTDGWYRFTGFEGLVLGIDTFGLSAPGEQVMEHFGFTGPALADRVLTWWRARG